MYCIPLTKFTLHLIETGPAGCQKAPWTVGSLRESIILFLAAVRIFDQNRNELPLSLSANLDFDFGGRCDGDPVLFSPLQLLLLWLLLYPFRSVVVLLSGNVVPQLWRWRKRPASNDGIIEEKGWE